MCSSSSSYAFTSTVYVLANAVQRQLAPSDLAGMTRATRGLPAMCTNGPATLDQLNAAINDNDDHRLRQLMATGVRDVNVEAMDEFLFILSSQKMSKPWIKDFFNFLAAIDCSRDNALMRLCVTCACSAFTDKNDAEVVEWRLWCLCQLIGSSSSSREAVLIEMLRVTIAGYLDFVGARHQALPSLIRLFSLVVARSAEDADLCLLYLDFISDILGPDLSSKALWTIGDALVYALPQSLAAEANRLFRKLAHLLPSVRACKPAIFIVQRLESICRHPICSLSTKELIKESLRCARQLTFESDPESRYNEQTLFEAIDKIQLY